MIRERTVGAYAALAAGVVAISWSAIFVRWAHMPGISSAFYRMFFASLALWPILIFSRRRFTPLDRRTIWLALLAGIFFAGDVGLYNISVLHTSAGSATFLGNNAPLVVGLLTWAITRKLPSRHFWIALAIGTSGAYLIVRGDVQHLSSRLSADYLAIMASICFAFFLLATERLRETCDTATLVALSTTASAFVLLLVALCGHVSLAVPDISSLAALFGLGLVCQLAGYLCLTYALGHLPATITSVVMLAVAPLTALLALIFFREQFAGLQILGAGLVLLGIWIVSNTERDQQPSKLDSEGTIRIV
ncbi:MAG: DMT family transporter [Edaphobacter sp.]